MTTYFAKHPERFVQKGSSLDAEGRLVNQVTGYKLVVHADEQSYDSFIQCHSSHVWEEYSTNRTLSDAGRKELAFQIQTGGLVTEQPFQHVGLAASSEI